MDTRDRIGRALGGAAYIAAAIGIGVLLAILGGLYLTAIPHDPAPEPGRPTVSTAPCPPDPSGDAGLGDTPCPTPEENTP
ncbi:hypothetical protein [Corynebacterium sphenisci]|uniref:hypothetical protein n=1 Tax=Corynebacterium sphenisci TaxID=191493 RepID=UPI0026E0EA05|nr:hypothetical protein [Corynebacterium sphenisci]MDO5730803.1 hypothetical protein [Corynebacterium sphenisci]